MGRRKPRPRRGDDDTEDEDTPVSSSKSGGYSLEYDAARKVAQGLGANLDILKSVIEVKGTIARFLPVAGREAFLFSRQTRATMAGRPSQPVEAASPETRQVEATGPRAAVVRRDGRRAVSPHSPP